MLITFGTLLVASIVEAVVLFALTGYLFSESGKVGQARGQRPLDITLEQLDVTAATVIIPGVFFIITAILLLVRAVLLLLSLVIMRPYALALETKDALLQEDESEDTSEEPGRSFAKAGKVESEKVKTSSKFDSKKARTFFDEKGRYRAPDDEVLGEEAEENEGDEDESKDSGDEDERPELEMKGSGEATPGEDEGAKSGRGGQFFSKKEPLSENTPPPVQAPTAAQTSKTAPNNDSVPGSPSWFAQNQKPQQHPGAYPQQPQQQFAQLGNPSPGAFLHQPQQQFTRPGNLPPPPPYEPQGPPTIGIAHQKGPPRPGAYFAQSNFSKLLDDVKESNNATAPGPESTLAEQATSTTRSGSAWVSRSRSMRAAAVSSPAPGKLEVEGEAETAAPSATTATVKKDEKYTATVTEMFFTLTDEKNRITQR